MTWRREDVASMKELIQGVSVCLCLRSSKPSAQNDHWQLNERLDAVEQLTQEMSPWVYNQPPEAQCDANTGAIPVSTTTVASCSEKSSFPTGRETLMTPLQFVGKEEQGCDAGSRHFQWIFARKLSGCVLPRDRSKDNCWDAQKDLRSSVSVKRTRVSC